MGDDDGGISDLVPTGDPEDVPDLPDARVVFWVVGGCALFVLLSIAAPAGYHYFQPAEHYFSVEEVDVMVHEENPCVHELETVYWAREGMVIDSTTTLYLVNIEDGSVKEIQIWEQEGYLEGGINRYQTEREYQEPLEPGVYRYEFDITFGVSYRWDKNYVAESEDFAIYYGSEKPSWAYGAGSSHNYSSQATCTS